MDRPKILRQIDLEYCLFQNTRKKPYAYLIIQTIGNPNILVGLVEDEVSGDFS